MMPIKLNDALSNQSEQNEICAHKEEWVEYIGALEYPGGCILWCTHCGAWCDDNDYVWYSPKSSDKLAKILDFIQKWKRPDYPADTVALIHLIENVIKE